MNLYIVLFLRHPERFSITYGALVKTSAESVENILQGKRQKEGSTFPSSIFIVFRPQLVCL